ncbi:Cupin domain-containing protein [Balamuthia mandrillaris]
MEQKQQQRSVVRLSYSHAKEGEYAPPNIVQGSPSCMVNNLYLDPSKQFSSGVWSSTVGKWTFEQNDSEEFCYILEGVVRLGHDFDGHVEEFKAGDAFIIPIGFKGYWETVEDLRKFYCVWEPKPAAATTSSS